jgi:pimeloyl-ACP methyl ester carboxylesterase
MQTMDRSSATLTCELSDGRTLAYAEYGDRSGDPLFLLHGFPDSRLTRYPDDALTASLGVRLLIPDRPGIGGSDFHPARSILDRVDDLVSLADHLALERFAVLGWSAGGPYALACAAKLPDRLTAVGVACGFAPMDRPNATEGMSTQMQRFIPLLRRLPWLARPMMASLPKQYRKNAERAFQKQFAHGLSPEDAQILARPEIRQNLLDGAVEAMRQGGRGPATEMQLLFARPWGFRLEDIVSEVHLWYGDADALVPLQTGRYLARTIPHAHLTVCAGEGHMLYATRWEELLSSLTTDRNAAHLR